MPTVGAVDVGSNAIRLAVVEVGASGVVDRELRRRYALRLGADVFAHGRIGPEARRRLLEIFRDIARRLERMRVERYRAVATSATRDAKNGAAVLKSIFAATGIELEVISGVEEGRLARASLSRALGELPRGTALIDVGGGSVEIVAAHGNRGVSLPLGSVRLLQRLPWLGDALSPTQLVEARVFVRTELERLAPNLTPAELAVFTGGALEILARLA
jgi:exopolyphosphatase / guanosine-5'-triphosphate,3'-diphosphate pyrophosphatase